MAAIGTVATALWVLNTGMAAIGTVAEVLCVLNTGMAAIATVAKALCVLHCMHACMGMIRFQKEFMYMHNYDVHTKIIESRSAHC